MPKSKEEVKKSIEELVDKAFDEAKPEEAKPAETVEKAARPKEHEEANSGQPGKPDDKIKSGTPKMQGKEELKKKDKKVKKSEEAAPKKEEAPEKPLEKAEEKPEEVIENKEEFKLDDEEKELVKAWRAQKETEEKPKENEKVEELTKTVKDENEGLKKSLSEQADLIKSLTEKVEKLASQPAYDKRSISALEPIEKSDASDSKTISKAQIAERMFELQKAGKGVTSRHVTEFEATGNISNAAIKKLVMESFN